jgi:excisionase family DNA binding protein
MSTLMQAPETTPTWLTFGRAARRLGISVGTMRRLAESGRVTVRSIPGSWPRVPASEVDEILESSTRPRSVERED